MKPYYCVMNLKKTCFVVLLWAFLASCGNRQDTTPDHVINDRIGVTAEITWTGDFDFDAYLQYNTGGYVGESKNNSYDGVAGETLYLHEINDFVYDGEYVVKLDHYQGGLGNSKVTITFTGPATGKTYTLPTITANSFTTNQIVAKIKKEGGSYTITSAN